MHSHTQHMSYFEIHRVIILFWRDDASTSIEENPCWVNKELTHCVYYLVHELVANTISNSVMFAFHKNQTNVHYCFKIDFACVYFIRAVISLCREDGCMIKKWPATHSQELYSNTKFLAWSIYCLPGLAQKFRFPLYVVSLGFRNPWVYGWNVIFRFYTLVGIQTDKVFMACFD